MIKPQRKSFLWCKLLAICICSGVVFSQNYDKIFAQRLFSEDQTLTLNKIVNSTSITIYKNPKHQTFLQNEPFKGIRDLISMNITYSQQEGFPSEWSHQRNINSTMNILGVDFGQSTKDQVKQQISCKTTIPEIQFVQSSSFHLDSNKPTHASTVVTSFDQLLHSGMVLDIWKDQSGSQENRIFVILDNGDLVVAKLVTNQLGKIEYGIKKQKIADSLNEAEFNSERFERERKLYIFSEQVEVQINLSNSNIEKNQFELTQLKIARKKSNMKIRNFKWIWNRKSQPILAILTENEFQLYEFNQDSKIYNPILGSHIGIDQVASYLRVDRSVLMNNNKQSIRFRKLFYLEERNLFLIIQEGFGMFIFSLSTDNKVVITDTSSKWSDCYDGELASMPIGLHPQKYVFFVNCKNYLRKHEITFQRNKMKTQVIVFKQAPIPPGEIMVSTSRDMGELIFVKGQAKLNIFRSWKYPKTLNQQNWNIDNLFVFANQYVAISQYKVSIGTYLLNKEKLTCSFNEEKQISQEKTSEQQQISSKQLQTESKDGNIKISLYIEYLAECNTQILSQPPYSLDQSIYASYEYCRYKKQYTGLQLKEITLTNSTAPIPWQIYCFSIAIVILFLGIAIWVKQKRKIATILEQEGMPVGSEDFQTQPEIENNLNLQLN